MSCTSSHQYQEQIAELEEEVERLQLELRVHLSSGAETHIERVLRAERDALKAEAERRITRLRKAVNWMWAALMFAPKPTAMSSARYRRWYEDTRWDTKRARALLDEERDDG